MRKFILIMLTLISTEVIIAQETNGLQKVTPENNPKCVEYFIKNGEVYCSTTKTLAPNDNTQANKYEKQKIMFDDRTWQPAWHKHSSSITTIEYLPEGGDINNWHELITSQFIPAAQDKISPQQFAENVIGNLKDSGFSPVINMIEDTDDRVIFEFRITEPENQKQDEIQMVTKGDDGLYILHYVIKESDMGTEKRELWIKNLKNSSIIDE